MHHANIITGETECGVYGNSLCYFLQPTCKYKLVIKYKLNLKGQLNLTLLTYYFCYSMHLILLILMLNNIPLYGYHVLFIYPCAVGDLGSSAILTALKNFL